MKQIIRGTQILQREIYKVELNIHRREAEADRKPSTVG